MNVLYTAIFGGRDDLHEPQNVPDDVRCICFTDDESLRSKRWEIRPCDFPSSCSPLEAAKGVKLHPHVWLPAETTASLWIDGRFELRDLNGVFDMPPAFELGLIRKTDFGLYEELDDCVAHGRDERRRLLRAFGRYADEFNLPVWLGGVLFRRHTPKVALFNEFWMREIKETTWRDQISLPVVLRQLRMKVFSISRDWSLPRPSHSPRLVDHGHRGEDS